MYNTTYINDFPEQLYQAYLNNPKELTEVERNYLLQYKKGSNAVALAFKESLDHYVLMKLATDNNYINSKEFYNYINYIMHVFEQKKFVVNDKTFNLELNTNIVFRDEKLRNKIFQRFYPEKLATSLNSYIKNNESILNNIIQRIEKRKKISQKEIDFLSDYIYSSRNFTDDKATKLVEYIFNEIDESSGIKTSVEILGAVTSYFTQCYTKDDKVKNSRTFIADFDNRSNDLAHSSGNRKYCYFNRSGFLSTSLISDSSLNKSRTFENRDLYFLMMVSFHELTHEYQKNLAKESKCTSGGMSFIVRKVLNDNLEGYTKASQGNKKSISEYCVNHDSSEFEIQADEEAWRQCKSFIAKHCRNYAYYHQKDSKKAMDREMQCQENEKEIRARRAFSLKEDKDGAKMHYALYDVKKIVDIVGHNPKVISQYPMLKKYLDDEGRLKISVLFSENITSTDIVGLDVDDSGLEFATYMLDYESKRILKTIETRNLSPQQIDNLMLNIYNVMHQNVLKIRDVDQVNFNNYKETKHKYDLENKSDEIYNYYFRKNAHEVYIAMRILYKIHDCYPNMEVSRYDHTMYYVSYFYELFPKIKNYDMNSLQQICDSYDKSNAPILMQLSNFVKLNLSDPKASNDNKNGQQIGNQVGSQGKPKK